MTQTLHLFLILVGMLSFDAMAQWAWIDQEGRQVFSDRAPPLSVPQKNVFKRPGQTTPLSIQQPSANTGTAESVAKIASTPQPVASSPQATGIDKDLNERLKKAAQNQASQQKAEEERISKLKADNCARATLAQKNLDSGGRLTRINSQGVREVMSEAARAEEAKHIQSIMDSDCR
jgi:predicted component of type VI protein secretion system